MPGLLPQTAIRREGHDAPSRRTGSRKEAPDPSFFFFGRLAGGYAMKPCQPGRYYGAVQPVNAKFSVGSLELVTVLPEFTVTELLVMDVGEQVIRPFEPSASALTV
jgi:hypothetical protein